MPHSHLVGTTIRFIYTRHRLDWCHWLINYPAFLDVSEGMEPTWSPASLMALESCGSVKTIILLTEWALFTVIGNGKKVIALISGYLWVMVLQVIFNLLFKLYQKFFTMKIHDFIIIWNKIKSFPFFFFF